MSETAAKPVTGRIGPSTRRTTQRLLLSAVRSAVIIPRGAEALNLGHRPVDDGDKGGGAGVGRPGSVTVGVAFEPTQQHRVELLGEGQRVEALGVRSVHTT